MAREVEGDELVVVGEWTGEDVGEYGCVGGVAVDEEDGGTAGADGRVSQAAVLRFEGVVLDCIGHVMYGC